MMFCFMGSVLWIWHLSIIKSRYPGIPITISRECKHSNYHYFIFSSGAVTRNMTEVSGVMPPLADCHYQYYYYHYYHASISTLFIMDPGMKLWQGIMLSAGARGWHDCLLMDWLLIVTGGGGPGLKEFHKVGQEISPDTIQLLQSQTRQQVVSKRTPI